ncbi:MAG: lipopolysaccharide biosynthesis protein [Alicyclobacillaceae bacterium]|nr:lipopolysaccharide biosynthesis protein [Alicyclobacillaceae bacterium]
MAIAVFTRLLPPEEYGRYALVVAGVGFFNVVFFQWLRLSLLRFLPAYLENPSPLLGTILAGFTVEALLTGGLGLGLVLLWPDPTWRGLLLLAVPLLWAQAWFELNLELFRSKLQPLRYGVASGLKAVSALGMGAVLVLLGYGTYGLLVGLLFGMLLGGMILSRAEWVGVRFQAVRELVGQVLHYGLPLTATFALDFVVSSSDRFFVAYFLGEGPAGVYAAGYNVPWALITMLMMVVNSAAYPLAVRALENEGISAAQTQLIRNSTLLLMVSLPATAGIILLSTEIGSMMLGSPFREEGAPLIHWIALATFVAGIKTYHFDLAFQLGKYTMGQVWVTGAAALTNSVLNLFLIPKWGLVGAAWATLGAYGLALILSAYLGRKVFVISLDIRQTMKIALATLLMSIVLILFPPSEERFHLFLKVIVGITAYVASVLALNVRRVQSWLQRRQV